MRVYRRPSYNKQLLFDILYNSFNSYNLSNNNIILCGDFNINCMDSLDSQPFFNILHQLDLFYVIHTPTRFSTSTDSLIDNFCIDTNLINIMCAGILCSDITGHLPLYINIHLNLNIIENYIYIYILVRETYHLNVLIILYQIWTNVIGIWLLVYPILIVYMINLYQFSLIYIIKTAHYHFH